jgi:tetratricopeptide (TPR) repeat protein
VEIRNNEEIRKEFNKGIELLDKKRFTKALSIFKKIVKQTEFREVYMNMGIAYKNMNEHLKCKECFEKASDSDLPFSDGSYKKVWPLALSNMGLLAYTFEQDDAAIALHKAALASDPTYYEAIWNLSLAELRKVCSNKSDNVDLAWEYYSWRFKRNKAEALKNKKRDLMFWDFKTPYPDESLVLLVEQGIGDTIMFARWIPYLETMFKKVYVQCTLEMDYLFENACRDASETDAVFGVPIASLGKLGDIPRGDWLRDKYIPKVGGDMNIMCVWQGNPTHANDANRSTHAGYFDRLKKFGKLHSIVPRKGYETMPIVNWKETIKYLEGIDIVVTIDSSMAHLCGALGKPCLVLMALYDNDFRWGDSSMGTSNVWYDSVKVIRNEHNWEKVFDKVCRELSTWVELPTSRES